MSFFQIVAVLVIVLGSLLALGLLGRSPAFVTRWPALWRLHELSREASLLMANPLRFGAVLGLSIVTIVLAVIATGGREDLVLTELTRYHHSGQPWRIGLLIKRTNAHVLIAFLAYCQFWYH